MQSMQAISTERVETQLNHEAPRQLASEITAKLSSQTKLVSLVAPAGYGKTILSLQCQQTMQQQGIDCRYIKLDAIHNKRAGFTALLRSQSCALEERSQRRENIAKRESFNGFRKMLVDAFSRRKRELVIVLDGMENIRSREITDFINSLIVFSSSHVRFVLSSRITPDLPLSDLRIQGRLYEPVLEQLALSTSEIKAVVQSILEKPLSESLLVGLQSKTQGWATGVVAALQAMQESSDAAQCLSEFTGRDRTLMSYFREKVISELDVNTQRMLLASAQKSRVTASFVESKFPNDSACDFMEEVTTQGVFVTGVSRDRTAFSFHPLFHDYLKYESINRLERTSETDKQDKAGSAGSGEKQVIYADFESTSNRAAGDEVSRPVTVMIEPLTSRELQLLTLISCGDTNREVAEKLFISEQTVKWHMNKVYAKMDVKNRTTAVAKARSYQLI